MPKEPNRRHNIKHQQTWHPKNSQPLDWIVTLRNAIILRAAHGVAGPFVAQFSRATSRVLAEAESRSPTAMARRVGKGLGILLHFACKIKQQAAYKTEAKRPEVRMPM